MGLTNGGPTPPGALFHWAAMGDNGLRVVDVWKTREEFDKFAQEEIGPFSAEVGVAEPALKFYDVHSYVIEAAASWRPSSVDRLASGVTHALDRAYRRTP